jgi:hypothetical protein
MEKFYNIEEQRHWNNDGAFSKEGHEWSSRFGSTENLWNTLLKEKVQKYCTGKGLEIAPGEGRITEYLIRECESLTLLELNSNPLSKCLLKFGNKINGYYVNDGKSIPPIFEDYFDFIFSFDSFVHVHQNVFFDYIKDMGISLKSGGFGVIHHGWLMNGSDNSFENRGGRANLNLNELYCTLDENGFDLIKSEECVVSVWFDDLKDLITIFKKR